MKGSEVLSFVLLVVRFARLTIAFALIVGKPCRKLNKKKTTDVRYCMSVKFLKNLCLSVCMVFISSVVALSLGGKRGAVGVVKTVYYVVQATESVGASSSQIALRGGAGYAIADGVAFGVYFSESEAEQTLRRLKCEYSQVVVYPLDVSIFSSEDGYAYNVLEIVGGWTEILQNGGAQATVREGLQSVARQLSWRGKKDNSALLLTLCEELKSRLAEKVLYVDALRNFICFGCEQLSVKNGLGIFFV